MTEVEFIPDNNSIPPIQYTNRENIPYLNSLIIKTGLVKTSQGANIVLIIMTIFFVILAVVITVSTIRGNSVGSEDELAILMN